MRPMLLAASLLLAVLLVVPWINASVDPDLELENRLQSPIVNSTIALSLLQRENWDGHSIGTHGELGPWQLTKAVWGQHSSKPFHWATCYTPEMKSETIRVVNAHIAAVKHSMTELNKPSTVYWFALLWGAGYGAVQRNEIKPEKREYALAVARLYYSP